MAAVAVVGASGRLGRQVVREVIEHPRLRLVAALTREGSAAIGLDAGVLAGIASQGVCLSSAARPDFGEAEVIIDVSLPEGTRSVLAALGGRALVSGVTGLQPADLEALQLASERSPVLLAANFSPGVHVLCDVVGRAAAALPHYDVEVVEVHHRHKVDAPSGTAKLLAEAVAQARGWQVEERLISGRSGAAGPRGEEIAIHALRCGDVVGEHTVWLAGAGERLLLGHVATSRQTFASGAARAASWIADREAGRYTMRDVLGLSERSA